MRSNSSAPPWLRGRMLSRGLALSTGANAYAALQPGALLRGRARCPARGSQWAPAAASEAAPPFAGLASQTSGIRKMNSTADA